MSDFFEPVIVKVQFPLSPHLMDSYIRSKLLSLVKTRSSVYKLEKFRRRPSYSLNPIAGGEATRL
jgi:hypothetical protein